MAKEGAKELIARNRTFGRIIAIPPNTELCRESPPLFPIGQLSHKPYQCPQKGTTMANSTTRPGPAEKAQLARKAQRDRATRIWAYLAIGVFLSLSLAANVLTAWDLDMVAKIVAGVPPLSLFVSSMLFERMDTSRPIRVGMLLVILVSLGSSWYHITELAYEKGQPLPIAILLPVLVDIPMLFAGNILIRQASDIAPKRRNRSTSNRTRTSTPKLPNPAILPTP